MKEVIPPVDKALIEKELTPDKLLRETNNAGNELYVITHQTAPNTLREIGRLREISFRAAGGGTGKDCDLDDYDTNNNPYKQLLVWDPSEKEILGGYRFHLGSEIGLDSNGKVNIATAKLFHFSDEFIENYLPYTIELGRSFVQPDYQSTKHGKKSLYALDNLWDGLGALYTINTNYKYFFGKVTMYTSYEPEARNLILYFLKKHFGDKDNLIYPFEPLDTNMDEAKMASILKAGSFKEDLKTLSQEVRARGEVIPPLINAYINLSPTLKCYGTILNHGFGGVEETAIMVTMDDIYPAKSERHIQSFLKWKKEHNR
ncbi:MAG: GNAT family N-acetyltransferase [Bacteroidales bacterium]|nr:GNAT family N-acetyltransferase [Bacteroidales bacterium]